MECLKLKAELRKLGPAGLLMMASNQNEHNCALNPNGSCRFYFKYKGFGFCVSELLGKGCHAEMARQGGENAKALITRAEDRKEDEMKREKRLAG